MSNLLVEKKGVIPKMLLLFGLLCGGFCGYYLYAKMYEHHYGDTQFVEFIKIAVPILMAILAVMCLSKAFRYGKTYIRVYDDHIEGMGIVKGGSAPHSFHFEKHMNYTVHVSNGELVVNCGNESYSISLTAEDAQEVNRCVHGGGSSRSASRPASQPKPQSAPQPKTQPQGAMVIAICPHCGTQCRVPAGKGRIRITCPKATCKIPFTFDSK